jgi:hypothetical protein
MKQVCRPRTAQGPLLWNLCYRRFLSCLVGLGEGYMSVRKPVTLQMSHRTRAALNRLTAARPQLPRLYSASISLKLISLLSFRLFLYLSSGPFASGGSAYSYRLCLCLSQLIRGVRLGSWLLERNSGIVVSNATRFMHICPPFSMLCCPV